MNMQIFEHEFHADRAKKLRVRDHIKNKLYIEDFSGTTPLAVKQDFFAVMFLMNLASMMIFENADAIDALHNSGDNKYEYKANVNMVISILKTDPIEMLITDLLLIAFDGWRVRSTLHI